MQNKINILTRLTYAASVVLLAASFCEAQEIRTVVAEGVGSDPQSAAQNAAQNALTNVVGSFIDADKQLEKRTEIANGIRSQTTQIKTDIKEYSQGSIQRFDIVETKKDGPYYKVTAKVGVRIEDFRVYIKKLAEGETAVGGGLFAEMTTTQKQSESLAKILSERILAVVNGEVVKFAVGKPIPFRQSRFSGGINQNGSGDIGTIARRFSPDQLAVFEVTATLDEAFLANLVQTLDSVAASKKRVSTSADADQFSFWPMYIDSGNCQDPGSSSGNPGQTATANSQRPGGVRLPNSVGGIRLPNSDKTSNPEPSRTAGQQQGDSSFCLPLMDSNPNTATVYRFSNVDHELKQYLPWTFNGNGSFDVAGDLIRGRIKLPTLEVSVLDGNKNELQVELNSGSGWGQPSSVGNTAIDTQYPWLLYNYYPGRNNYSGHALTLFRQRTFSVVMNINADALRRADTVRVKLVK